MCRLSVDVTFRPQNSPSQPSAHVRLLRLLQCVCASWLLEGRSVGFRCSYFALQVEPVLNPVFCRVLFEFLCYRPLGDSESCSRKNDSAYADSGFGCSPDTTAFRTANDWWLDMPLVSDLLQHLVEVVAQGYEPRKRHCRIPLGPQPLHHFREPHSVGISRWQWILLLESGNHTR